MQDQKTLADFIGERQIEMRVYRAFSNPNMDDSRDMDHWSCEIRVVGFGHRDPLALVYSMGKGHNGKQPTLAHVLDTLASDAAGVEGAKSFEEWCPEYGYDSDSRKAERIYEACVKQAGELRTLLGEEAYQELLYGVERQ